MASKTKAAPIGARKPAPGRRAGGSVTIDPKAGGKPKETIDHRKAAPKQGKGE
ncbi:hypothetical protein [Ferruginivarius sediminum]|uniref:hypothetical protein n=1 Tax=Ferruginivarius sediminum TaxID=2661937 RepID=UPI0012939B20|nr:hypothetical protein [Ferruginivarius sediminum]